MATASRKRRPAVSAVQWVTLLVVAAFVIVPFYTTAIGGFKEIGELRVNPFGLPQSWDPVRFAEIIGGPRYVPSLLNSLLVALGSVVLSIGGLFAGLAGSLDVLGWQFRVATNTVQISSIGFLGIAVALLGRNTAVGVFFSALFFGALVTGTSVRNLDPEVFEPALASNLMSNTAAANILLEGTTVSVA